ncbi:MAG: DUF4926 domain-containing protein [Chloroflexi bacterium]|nr:DUF4926 domain-containing protein [Chloroflexota bacterium]
MVRELDTVVLAHNLKGYPLKTGDVGGVVYAYRNGKAFEVEFVAGDGETVAVVTLLESDIRPIYREEILHVRALAPA